jgi:hypothetical protein
MRSPDFINGMTAGMVWISDIFELHTDAFVKKGLLRKKDVKLILNIIDAAIRRRETLADVGPRNMNLFVGANRSASLKEK